MAVPFGRLFRHVTLIPAGLPSAVARNPIMFERDPKTGAMQMRGTSGSSRVDRLASQLVRWADTHHESFDHVSTVLRRIGVSNQLAILWFGDDHGYIVLDDLLSMEYASDGTLRIIEIVVALEMAAAGALVMIEEPETGIHPGLCDRIMAEIEAAAGGLQLIISTHSPRIVDRVKYHQLRHVRRNGSTRIEALGAEQVEVVKEFLSDHGTLSDFIFSEDFEDE